MMGVSVLSLMTSVILIIGTVASLLGGLTVISRDHPDVQDAAIRAQDYMSTSTNGKMNLEVISAKVQIIAGTAYYLKVLVTMDEKKQYECDIKVEHRYDLGGEWIVKSNNPEDECHKLINNHSSGTQSGRQRSTHLLGGKEELDLSQQDVKEAANWAVDHINEMSNSLYRQALQEIALGSRQIVNGYKYRFLLYLVSTMCRNNKEHSGKSLEDCPVGDKLMKQQCDVTVLYSNQKYSMLKSKCKALKIKDRIVGEPHGKANTVLGGDNHDYEPHGNANSLLGGGDHDYKPHGNANSLLGGDDHGYKPHSKTNFLGQDWHDYIPHLKSNVHGLFNAAGKNTKDKLVQSGKDVLEIADTMKKMNILGGDNHDYQPHGNNPCQQYQNAFKEFKSKYQRLYTSSQEEAEKFQIFCGNMERIKEYQKMERGSAIYGATQFADISESEFKEKYLGWKMNDGAFTAWPPAEIPKGPIPETWDWRDHNAVTPVKNQGSCGSCWAFSTTGNIEGKNAIKHKTLVSLSEQELLDCDEIDEACNGGLPSQAYEAIMKLGGIETEKDYAYEAEKETCHFQKSEIAVKVTGAVNISQEEGDMAAWLYKNGPISIGINAFAMQFYFGGISHPWRIFCNPKNLDHGVLIVGYGKDGDEPYWIVKNSWGTGWGREGYYYVYRGDGTCGLNTMCTSATVE